MANEFKLQKHTETHSYVFDRKTGEILAEHTRWVEEGAEAGDDDSGLLESIARDSGRAAKDLDVLQAKPRVTRDLLRVDVKARKVVTERRPKPQRVFMADPIERP